MNKTSTVLYIAIMLIVTALVIPLGLGLISSIGNYVTSTETIGTAGLYPATYTFTDDNTGDTGTDISFIDFVDVQGSNTEIEVSETLGNHDKILKMTDNYVAGYIDCRNTFTPQTYGTVEFWIRTTDKTKGTTVCLRDTIDDNAKIEFLIVLSDFRYWCASGYETSSYDPETNNNIWYHVRIDFRCYGASAYMSLTQNTWKCYVNSIDSQINGSIGYGRNVNNISVYEIISDMADANYYTYFDAIGYTWNDYEIGDNLNDVSEIPILLSDVLDDNILTIATVLIPLLSIIGVGILFFPKTAKKSE